MEDKEIIRIGKIISTIAVLLCVVSFILPWMGFSYNIAIMNAGVDVYPWGMHIYTSSFINPSGASTPGNVWAIFYYFFIGSIPGSTSTTTITVNTVSTILLLMSFVFLLVSLIIGVLSIKRITFKKGFLSLLVGIAMILAMIFFYAGITNTSTSTSTYFPLQWTTGFYLAVISMILFFISFWVIRSINPKKNENISKEIPPV